MSISLSLLLPAYIYLFFLDQDYTFLEVNLGVSLVWCNVLST